MTDANSAWAALGALDLDDVVARVAARLSEDPTPGSRVALEYAFDLVEDPEEAEAFDPRLPEHAAGFAAFVRGMAYEETQAAIIRLSTQTKPLPDGRIEVWREISVPRDWTPANLRDRPLGVFWAYERDAAEAHWAGGGEGADLIVIHGAVEADDVDWVESVVANAAEGATVGEEREIRLCDTALVEVLGVAQRDAYRRGMVALAEGDAVVGEVLPAGEAAPAPGPR